MPDYSYVLFNNEMVIVESSILDQLQLQTGQDVTCSEYYTIALLRIGMQLRFNDIRKLLDQDEDSSAGRPNGTS